MRLNATNTKTMIVSRSLTAQCVPVSLPLINTERTCFEGVSIDLDVFGEKFNAFIGIYLRCRYIPYSI